ncbi:MAG: FkbM family methyltransferase [Myxococcota bacterium]
MKELLEEIGRDPETRQALVDALRAHEARNRSPGRRLRDELTGPIVDALHVPGEAVPLELEDGTRLELPYRSKIARDIVLRDRPYPDHAFEPQTTKLLLRWAERARTVVIGGAYAGDHACVMARRMSPGSQVVAFEPNPEQRGFLERNLAANELQNVRPVPYALWDEDGLRLKLSGVDACAWVEPTDAGDGIPAMTFDRYAREQGIERVDVMILDIEGSELRALRGARSFLSRDDGPDVIFEVNRAYCDWSQGLRKTDIVRFMEGQGYSVWALRDFQSNISMTDCNIELVELEGCFLEGPPHGFNMVATKRPEQFGDEVKIMREVSPKLLLHRDPSLHAPTEWRSE